MTIVNYTSSSVNKLRASLNDDARVVIYDCHMFIVQATATHDVTTLLALANRNDPICVALPKVAKASKEGDITTHHDIDDIIAYKLRQCTSLWN